MENNSSRHTVKTWKDYAPTDPDGLRPFIEYLVEETFVKPLKNEVDGKPFETYEEAYDRVMKEVKTFLDNYHSSNESVKDVKE